MDQEPDNRPLDGIACLGCFPEGRIHGNHHIPEHGRFSGGAVFSHGKGEDVCRAVLVKVSPVQFGDHRVIGEQDAQLDVT